MDGSVSPPVVTLALGLVSAFLLFLGPIVLALINRGGRSTSEPTPNVDLIADLDEANDRLTAEIRRKDREIDRLHARLDREGNL